MYTSKAIIALLSAILTQAATATENFVKILEHTASTDIHSESWSSAQSRFPDVKFAPEKNSVRPSYLSSPDFPLYWEGEMKKPGAFSPNGVISEKWLLILKGTKDHPVAIDVVRLYKEVDTTMPHLNALQSNDVNVDIVRCPPEKELGTFGNSVYRIGFPSVPSQLVKESWDCGNRTCAQTFSFFMSQDQLTDVECSAP